MLGALPGAGWNCWTTPPPGPVPNVGSGKFGTPCDRMHLAIASAAVLSLADCDADGRPPFGRYEWHVCIADWNAGPLTATPLTIIEAPDPVV